MRRASALFALPLIAAAALVTGCSSAPSDPNSSVSVSGKFGAAPTVTIPAKAASANFYKKTVINGTGATATSSDSTVDNYSVYDWSGKTHKMLMSTFTQHMPSVMPSTMMPGLNKALKGAKEGSRIVAVIPPKDGPGPQASQELGIKSTDTLVFVIDVMKAVSNTASATGKQVSSGGGSLAKVNDPAAGTAPTITVPKSSAPSQLTTTTLIKGSGPKVAKGQDVIVQYTGSIWRTGKTFSSSWANKTPFVYEAGATPTQVIPGWDKGILGQTVGSRVMLTIPSAEGYGKSGNAQAGIKGTDTLVFVVDILGTANPS